MFISEGQLNVPGGRYTERLVFHEGWPGHALEYQKEAERQRDVRPHPIMTMLPFTAYLEGWATYAESRIAYDLNLYTSDTARVYEAARVAFNSRRTPMEIALHRGTFAGDAAVAAYVRAGQNPATVRAGLRRFYDWPGQGLSYHAGAEVLLRQREVAERVLGACFDVRRFHEAVLGDGPLPLGALERKLSRWTERERSRVKGQSCRRTGASGGVDR